MENYYYYCDYFVTPVGYYLIDCDGYQDQWGTQDGAYWWSYRENCFHGTEVVTCWQKVSGNWVQINCP